MNRDQEIYIEVAAIIHKASPNISLPVHALIYISPHSIGRTYWNLESNGKLVGLKFPKEASRDLDQLLKELQAYYEENNLNSWNVVHIEYEASSSSINFDYDFSKALPEGEISLYDYFVNRFKND